MDKNIANRITELMSKGYKRKEIVNIIGITINQYKHYQSVYKLNPKKSDCNYMNKEWLEEMYNKYNSATKIGELCGVSAKTISYWRNKLGIPKSDMSNNAKKYTANYNYFEKIDNEHKAYWLGFIMADGCIHQKGEKSFVLTIGLARKDKTHLEKFIKDIDSTHKIYDVTSYNNYTNGEVKNCVFNLNNKKICNDLISLGCKKRKSGHEKIPNIPDDLIRHFIRGFFDGDGCISYYNHVNYSFELCSASKEIMLQIQNILKHVTNDNIPLKKIENGKYNIDFYVIKVANIKKNLAIYSYLFKDSTIYLDRKYERVLHFFKEYSSIT